jgi:hypothetical protein
LPRGSCFTVRPTPECGRYRVCSSAAALDRRR